MAVAYSNFEKISNNSVVRFPVEKSKEYKIVYEYIDSIDNFKQECRNKTKSMKQLLKQYNEIVANTKKTEKAIISGKLNHTINQHDCEQFASAKKDLQKAFSDVQG